MAEATPAPDVVRFGEFVLDLRSGELERNGVHRMLLPDQPFRLLTVLIRQHGTLVTRDALRHELWTDDTFVDFEHGLNAAVKRLREVLGDSAASPRFIETLPRRGYRFIAPIDWNHSARPENGPEPRRLWPPAPAADGPVQPGATQRTPSGRRWLGYGLGAGLLLVLGLLAARWLPALESGSASPPVIAVLPFTNLSTEPDSDLFVDGLTDEVIRDLSIIEGLGVRSRHSSFRFKNRPRATREVGALLHATHLLEGSVLREGTKLRVNVQLVRVADDVPVWSGRFDKELKDVFAIQDEISRSIVSELQLTLGGGQRHRATSVEAYDAFLKGRALQVRRSADARGAIAAFRQAVEKDPAYAPAYAGLASAAAESSYLFPSNGSGALPDDEALAIMRPAARKALQLDPSLAEAHAAMGHVHAVDREWSQAEESFRHALALDPSSATTYTDFVLSVLFPEGRLDEAIRYLETALVADPLSLDVRRVLAHVQISAGQYDRAIQNCDRVLAQDPGFPFVTLWRARALLHSGRVAEAMKWFEGPGRGAEGYLGYAYAVTGRRDEAVALAAKNADYPQRLALIYAGLGDNDRAFDALDRLAAVNPRRTGAYVTRPEFARLRGDPRMAALRGRLGLPPL